jgi:pimeloyl-ACP methyl ester carboxylesterase
VRDAGGAASSHDSVETRFVETAAARFGYRRLGPERGVPLLLLQHFRGTMDSWDPSVVDALAARRPLVLFDNRGVGRSSGPAPDTVAQMASDAVTFVDALGLTHIDLLGFSLGGMIAQQTMFDHPSLVRRAILVGTGGPGADGMFGPEVTMEATKAASDVEALLFLFFRPTAASRTAGRRYLERISTREDREPPASEQAIRAQLAAIRAWSADDGGAFARLRRVDRPILVVNGVHDIMIPAYNAFALAQQLQNAQLVLYSDAGHGSLFQDPDAFVHDASYFLERD